MRCNKRRRILWSGFFALDSVCQCLPRIQEDTYIDINTDTNTDTNIDTNIETNMDTNIDTNTAAYVSSSHSFLPSLVDTVSIK